MFGGGNNKNFLFIGRIDNYIIFNWTLVLSVLVFEIAFFRFDFFEIFTNTPTTICLHLYVLLTFCIFYSVMYWNHRNHVLPIWFENTIIFWIIKAETFVQVSDNSEQIHSKMKGYCNTKKKEIDTVWNFTTKAINVEQFILKY